MERPHEILGVSEKATFEEIKKAYRALSLKYHPDMHDATENEYYNMKMAEINGAFEYYKKIYAPPYNDTNTKQGKGTGTAQSEEERKKAAERFWEEFKRRGQEEYRASGKKMRDKLARNLDPILEVNKKFRTNIDGCSDYNALYKLAIEYADQIEKMISLMYEYTEKRHRYGMPPESFYKNDLLNENVNIEFPLIKVKSSQIDAIGYDKENQLLYVRFLAGSLYVYYKVEENVYEEFMSSWSKGRYFGGCIVNKYQYTRLK